MCRFLFLIFVALCLSGCSASSPKLKIHSAQIPVTIENEGWQLKADLYRPVGKPDDAKPAALLLHGATGERSVYGALGLDLAKRGITALAVDLRGHGESINLGEFKPPYAEHRYLNQNGWRDIIAALKWMSTQPDIDMSRAAIVSASYSGEQVGIALREGAAKGRVYVTLSPGNFSEDSMGQIDDEAA